MKILFISFWYPTVSNPNNGIFIKEHAHAIHSAGNEIVVLAVIIKRSNILFSKSYTEYVDESGVRTICLELETKFYDIFYHAVPIQYIYLLHAAKKLIKTGFSPDIIHSNVVFPAGILGHWLSKKLKLPHIITEHWSRLPRFMKKPVLSQWARSAYEEAKFILPVSLFLKKRIQNEILTLPDQKFSIIGNIIDTGIFNYKKKISNPEIIQFCAIATWANKKIPDKLPELFIEALSKVQTGIDAKISLTMIGGGDKLDELQNLCITKNINCTFTGYIPKNEIVKYLQISDFFIHASTIETFGVGVAEALMCGVPVICSNVGALPELVNETNGILCNNTIDEWIEGIKCAIKSRYDRQSISNRIGIKFGLNEIGVDFNKIYEKINC